MKNPDGYLKTLTVVLAVFHSPQDYPNHPTERILCLVKIFLTRFPSCTSVSESEQNKVQKKILFFSSTAFEDSENTKKGVFISNQFHVKEIKMKR